MIICRQSSLRIRLSSSLVVESPSMPIVLWMTTDTGYLGPVLKPEAPGIWKSSGVYQMTKEKINLLIVDDEEQFLESIRKNVAPELNKIGLYLINVNITDITDESDYIGSIGKKAAAVVRARDSFFAFGRQVERKPRRILYSLGGMRK